MQRQQLEWQESGGGPTPHLTPFSTPVCCTLVRNPPRPRVRLYISDIKFNNASSLHPVGSSLFQSSSSKCFKDEANGLARQKCCDGEKAKQARGRKRAKFCAVLLCGDVLSLQTGARRCTMQLQYRSLLRPSPASWGISGRCVARNCFNQT